MQRAIAGSTLEMVPAAGHLASMEQPAVFSQALARFLAHRV
jgi:pimeloyl-ACP methyl ester carboxylesterase